MKNLNDEEMPTWTTVVTGMLVALGVSQLIELLIWSLNHISIKIRFIP